MIVRTYNYKCLWELEATDEKDLCRKISIMPNADCVIARSSNKKFYFTEIPSCISELKQLKKLDLGGQKITKIKNLSNLKKLSELHLSSNEIEKIENIASLKKHLKELDLYNNQVSKIENLDGFTNLTRLSIGKNFISKIEGLDGLRKLRILDLSDNRRNIHFKGIERIEGLRDLGNLRSLSLEKNNIEKIEGIGHLLSLNELNLSNNEIKKIEGLDFLINLKELNLSNNPIKKIEGLERLPLKRLLLGGSPVKTEGVKMENLDSLKDTLITLDLKVKGEIGGLDKLKALRELKLVGNFEKIQGLENLKYLAYLTMHGKIKKIEGLDNFIELQRLNLSNNEIGKMEGLDKLGRFLTDLNLNENKIKRIEGVKNLKKLCILDLHYNEIEKLDEKDIDGLDNLNFLGLTANTKLIKSVGRATINGNLEDVWVAEQLFFPMGVSIGRVSLPTIFNELGSNGLLGGD